MIMSIESFIGFHPSIIDIQSQFALGKQDKQEHCPPFP
jgi:hypothetical protein